MNNEISGRISVILQTTGQTQTDFANSISTSRTSVANWLKGVSEPSCNYLRNIVIIFNVDAHWLLTGQGNMYSSYKAEPPDLNRESRDRTTMIVNEPISTYIRDKNSQDLIKMLRAELERAWDEVNFYKTQITFFQEFLKKK